MINPISDTTTQNISRVNQHIIEQPKQVEETENQTPDNVVHDVDETTGIYVDEKV